MLKISTDIYSASVKKRRRNELRDKVGEVGKLVEILSQAHERESERRAHMGQAMPEPKFTRDEFERIADNAATTRDAAMLRRLHEFERQSISYADPKERISPERQLARALGREAMAEVFLHESAERLSSFHDRKEVQPLLIEMPDGRLITHRFKDTESRSILERIARPLVEAPAEREMREAVQSALQHQQHHLTGDLEKSRVYYEAALEIADSLSPATPCRLTRLREANPSNSMSGMAYVCRARLKKTFTRET